MKRIVAALTALTLAGIAGGLPASAEDRHQDLRERTCRFQWMDPGTWTDREERRTAACVEAKWPVPGGLPKMLQVGSCESGWYRLANNGGNYLGLFQHAASYWSGRVGSLMPRAWRLGQWSRWQNSRAQIVVTARMVHSGGWGPWTCA
jgi:hypothetical protein